MENKKLVRITDEQVKKVEFLKNLFNCSENTVFRMALEKLYKEFCNK